jgi:PAS domain S-box-containing protein
MAKSISVISTHKSLTYKIKAIIEEMQENIDVYTATLDEAVTLCKGLMEEGTRIFISRGGNAKYLRKKLGCTVVDISHGISDYLEAFERAKHARGKVGIFSYERKLEDIDAVGKLINIDMKQYIFSDLNGARKAVMDAYRDGVILGIGGVVTGKVAEELGIDYIVIDSSRSSIINAINAANQLLQVQMEENRKAENYKIQMENYRAILNFSYSGIIAIDENCIIRAFNPIAEQLLGIPAEKAAGKNIKELLPDTKLIKVLDSGVAELNQIMEINDKIIYTNRVPICINGRVKGVVATFEDVKKIQENEQEIRRRLYDKGLVAKYSFSDIVGSSKEIKQAIEIAKSYARTSSTVLIQGETGTGKELFAQSMHNYSDRRGKPFVAINCAALPKDLLESELFGYEDGTFTGARKGGKMGLFEAAHGGTIFLDEIAEIPLSLQAQMLRVLQEKEIRRLGSDKIIPVDVRVIAATNRNLETELKEGRFREDLFYRINVLKLSLPPLRERKGDIAEIGTHFLRKKYYHTYIEKQKLWTEMLSSLSEYPWYGNIRELENVLERLAVILGQGIINFNNYRNLIREVVGTDAIPSGNQESDSEDERKLIYEALVESNGCRTTAAKKLGISRSTLWRKIKKYGIST